MYYRIQVNDTFSIDMKSSHHGGTITISSDNYIDFMSHSQGPCTFCGFPRMDVDVYETYKEREHNPYNHLTTNHPTTNHPTSNYSTTTINVCCTFDGVCCCESLDDLYDYVDGVIEGLFVVGFDGEWVDTVFDGEVVKPTIIHWIKPARMVFENHT